MTSKSSKPDGEYPKICVEWQKPKPEDPDNFAVVFWNLVTLAIAMMLFVTLLNDRDQKRADYDSPAPVQLTRTPYSPY